MTITDIFCTASEYADLATAIAVNHDAYNTGIDVSSLLVRLCACGNAVNAGAFVRDADILRVGMIVCDVCQGSV
jgi:hypothetical protein